MKILNSLKSRRFKHGSMATIITIIFVAAVVLVNVIAGLVLERMPVSVDLTDDNIYQLTEDSLTYVKGIKGKVEIIVCYPEENLTGSTEGKQVAEIINSYAKQNPNISVRWTDLTKEPSLSTQYSEYGVTTFSIIVQSDKRVKVASLNDCLEQQTNQTTQETVTQSVAERVMTSAIMYATEDTVMKASVLSGHSDTPVDGLTSMLTDNNYEVAPLNITTEEIDPETSLIAIYAPTTDYTTEELAKLDKFLDNDGKFDKTVVYVASFAQPKLPNLESFLTEWGITVGDGVLAETDSKNIYDAQGYQFAASYLEEDDYRADLRDADLPFLAMYARPLSTAFETAGNRTAKLLLTAPDSTIIIPSDTENFDVKKAASGKGTGIAALGYRMKYEGTTPHTSYVLAFSSEAIFSQNFIKSSLINNNEYTISAINQMTGKQNGVDIAAVSFDAEKLNITQASFQAIVIVFVILVPIITLVLGVFVWLRRRNK